VSDRKAKLDRAVWDHGHVGLDIYVGSLTRYFVGDWELVAQKVARELGMPISVARQYDPPDAIRDPDQIRPSIIGWRDRLSRDLGGNLPSPLNWDESGDAPYFTDKPTWDCYGDLVLWAAYDEQPQLPRPVQHIEDCSNDPAYSLCAKEDFRSRYTQLYEITMRLPCLFHFVFEADDVGGQRIRIGSSVALVEQLEELNRRTWKADSAVLEKWAWDGSEFGAPLETGARFAFALFTKLTRFSVENALPMRLDW
jgi:hypothetical protein